MRRITHSTAAAAKPVPSESGTTGYWTKGNPGGGTPATVLTEEWFNDVQEELIAIILAAGLTPTENTVQLLSALYSLMTPTGTVIEGLWTTAAPGWVLLNDGTIGSATSGATTRANADTQALYTLLWNNCSDAACPVSGGRGASAAADFAANKTLRLPLARGRAIIGSGQGTGLTNRVLGSSLGTETHTLTEAEMPSHKHVGFGSGALGTGPNIAEGGATDANSIETALAGGGGSHPNMQPSLVCNRMIKL